jgi:hypothetical protein
LIHDVWRTGLAHAHLAELSRRVVAQLVGERNSVGKNKSVTGGSSLSESQDVVTGTASFREVTRTASFAVFLSSSAAISAAPFGC